MAGALLCLFTACQKKNAAAPAIPRDAEIEARVEKVLRGMSLEEVFVMITDEDERRRNAPERRAGKE